MKSAFIELDERSRIATFWTLTYINGDVLAMVISAGPEEPWILKIRIRTYHDAEVFATTDDKDGYTVTSDGSDDATRDELVASTQSMLEDMAGIQGAGSILLRVDVNGDDRAFARAFSSLPTAHVRVLAKEPEKPQ